MSLRILSMRRLLPGFHRPRPNLFPRLLRSGVFWGLSCRCFWFWAAFRPPCLLPRCTCCTRRWTWTYFWADQCACHFFSSSRWVPSRGSTASCRDSRAWSVRTGCIWTWCLLSSSICWVLWAWLQVPACSGKANSKSFVSLPTGWSGWPAGSVWRRRSPPSPSHFKSGPPQ